MKPAYLLIAVSIAVVFLGCGPSGPVPINYGADQCANCRMNIVDNRFGAETITANSKVYKFDSIECMTAFNMNLEKSSEHVGSLWVTDFYKPETLISLPSAKLIRTKGVRSPMGLGFAAVSTDDDMQKFTAEYGGELLNWGQITKIVTESWSSGH